VSYPKLRPEVKQAWVLALRSGDYQQGEGTLCDVNWDHEPSFWCCLGVLADQLELPFVINDDERARGYYVPGSTGPRYLGFLPGAAASLVLADGAEAGFEALMSKLVNLNDVEKLSFDEIADWVEANL
jgi:hypothetical protein